MGLDLIDREPDELWMEVPDIVQEAGIKTMPKKKKLKKKIGYLRISQIAVKRKEVKNKGEKESYAHLNEEFQITERRGKKVFLGDECKETEESNIMGKTRELFNKLEIPRGHFMQRWAQ